MLNPAQFTTSAIAKTALVGMLGAIPVLAPGIARTFGLTDSTLISEKADALLAFGGGLWMLGSLAWAFVARMRSKLQPLTFTKAAARAAITPSSQILQDTHDAIQEGAVVTDVTLVHPSAGPVPVVLQAQKAP